MKNDESNFLIDYSKFLDESGEHLTYAALSTYRNFADELSQKEKVFFTAHLGSCKTCSARLHEVEDIEGEMTKKQTAVIWGISPSIFRYAIAAVLVISIGIAVMFVMQNFQQQKEFSQSIRNESQITAAISDPENFIPNQTLENFIERTVRSAQSVSMITPITGDTITTPYTIRWKGPKEPYTVTIVNNKNAEVWKERISSTEVVLNDRLKEGLYYLKLEMNGHLSLVGKFIIIR